MKCPGEVIDIVLEGLCLVVTILDPRERRGALIANDIFFTVVSTQGSSFLKSLLARQCG